jgi:hypothetical protein
LALPLPHSTDQDGLADRISKRSKELFLFRTIPEKTQKPLSRCPEGRVLFVRSSPDRTKKETVSLPAVLRDLCLKRVLPFQDEWAVNMFSSVVLPQKPALSHVEWACPESRQRRDRTGDAQRLLRIDEEAPLKDQKAPISFQRLYILK